MKFIGQTVCGIALVVSAMGCGEVDRLHGMQDQMKTMDKTTKHMDQTTSDLNGGTMKHLQDSTDHLDAKMTSLEAKIEDMDQKTTGLSDVMGNVADTGRQGGSADLRMKLLDRMEAKQEIGTKVAMAAIYYASFEEQLWSGVGEDDSDEKHQSLMYQAVHEFFGDIREYLPKDLAPNPVAQVGPHDEIRSDINKQANLNALSAAMGWNNRKQAEAVKKHRLNSTASMFDMIADSLRAGKDLAAGRIEKSSLPPYQEEVLANKPIAIRLIENRLNFLPMFVMAELMPYSALSSTVGSSILPQRQASLEGAWAKLMSGHAMASAKEAVDAIETFGKATAKEGLMVYANQPSQWQVMIDKMDEPAISRLSGYLQEYQDTKALAQAVGLPTELDPRVKAFVKGLSYVTQGHGTAAVNAARTDLVGQLMNLKLSVN